MFYSKLDRLRFYLQEPEIQKWEKKFDLFWNIMKTPDQYVKFEPISLLLGY